MHPHFRGPNNHADACGSDLAVQDVLDAVSYMSERYSVDENRIYLVGVSGGGHLALLLAGRFPQRWAAVSAWCGIADIARWWRERSEGIPGVEPLPNFESLTKYARMTEMVLQGRTPVNCPEECAKRSPITYLTAARNVNLDIHAGIHDGRKGGSVPFSHSLMAYDAVVPPSNRLGPAFIAQFYRTQRPPNDNNDDDSQPAKEEQDNALQTRDIHFRRTCENTRVTIFEGGHEILHLPALNWLALQRRGQAAVWDIPPSAVDWFHVDAQQTQSGK